MSDRHVARFTLVLGVLGLLGTIAVQVYTTGSIKGMITTKITEHERRLDTHDTDLRQITSTTDNLGRDVAEIKGKLHGISSQVGRVPSRVAAKITGQESITQD
jgi:hypothetical protein